MVSLPSERFTRFGNPAWPGIRTANFAAFGSWPGVRQKDAESLRDSDALMRVAVPRRRGPAGLRDLFSFLLKLRLVRPVPDTSFGSPDAPACAVPVQACVSARSFSARSCSRVFGFVILLTLFDLLFESGDKKRPSTFRTLRPVNGQFFGIQFFKLAGGKRYCQNRLRTASPQGIAALAAQGGVATLTERSDATFSVGQFSSADRRMKLRRTHDTLDRRV